MRSGAVWSPSKSLPKLCRVQIQTCNMQSIVENAVSLHLRARRTGGSQQGTAAYLRAFARLSWHLRQPSLPLTTKRHFNDTDDPISRSLASAADSAIQTARARCLQMVDLLSVRHVTYCQRTPHTHLRLFAVASISVPLKHAIKPGCALHKSSCLC